MNLFKDFALISGIDINNPEFDKAGRIQDWRNYVPYEWQNNWDSFTDREKHIIAVMAEMQADKEEWD